MNARLWFFLALSALFLFPLSKAWAVGECEPWVARIVSVEGRVEAKRAGQVLWKPVAFKDTFCAEDTIRVEAYGRAALVLRNETYLRIDQGTAITFSEIDEKEPSWLELLKGAVHFLSRVPRTLKIKTAFVNAAIEGTEFAIRIDPQQATVWVFEGRVRASNEAGSLTLLSGQAAIARVGQAPVPQVVVRPRDAVQWALYYPPIIDYGTAAYPPDPGVPAIQEALARYQAGDLQGTFAKLATVSADLRDTRYYTLRAGLLLSVGRVDEARSDIEQILNIDPDNANAFALQAIIAVVQNEKNKALTLAQRAAELAPQSPTPQVALSYAYQTRFDIEKALEAAQEAVNLDSANALAWARLAELWLAMGNLDRALKAAQQSVRRNPDLARTQTVLGFAYLTRIETKQARAAFEKAIVLDQADPLPRLGLGLARICQSNLHQGRREIEIAASLDPNYSIIRSYLGKAYFEERRAEPAATEFAIARELDPRDPTPWFYDAIRKQLQNRPVQALDDLERSIELNDNRAVYRSRLLLDDDLAMRGVSLARIYDDLGFDQLALVEASKSLSIDPTSHSAHRFLSDTYARLPRHEIARVSELLQAQLLQPININPVQPRLAETDLGILTGAGPTEAAFNEFTPLFARNQMEFTASGMVGNHNMLGDEIVLSGIWDRFSYSFGQFHFETDGFRENNDIQHDIYNVFAQAALTARLDVQFEYRRRESEQGDLRLNFNPDNFSRTRKQRIERDTARLGLHLAPSPHSDFIASLIYSDQTGKTEEGFDTPVRFTFNEHTGAQGYDVQAQYLFRDDRVNLTVGAGSAEIDLDERFAFVFPDFDFTMDSDSDFVVEQHNVYAYASKRFPEAMLWTLGISYDSFDDETLDLSEINPKLGLQWNITGRLRLRAAAFKTLKRLLIVDQTIEPTQVAGFNQFFDDFNGTRTERYGIGLDIDFTDDLYGGIEVSRRDFEVPFFLQRNPPRFVSVDHEEDLYRAYLYWTPHRNWAFSAELRFEDIESETGASQTGGNPLNRPTKVETLSLPVEMRYFHPSGVFAELGPTYVHQEVNLGPVSTFDQTHDDFVLFDAAVGYRLPKWHGIASLEVRNLLDEEFLFQDLSFITPTQFTNPRFLPDRTILARFTLNF